MARDGSSPRKSAAWLNRVFPFAVLSLMAGLLWGTRPTSLSHNTSSSVEQTRACLSNLNRIAAAFAQYAGDYDGKFPRGVDAEDRSQPQSWPVLLANGKKGDARDVPMLQDLLFPYLGERKSWHCPADIGWTENHLPGVPSTLRNVKPSSYARYGTSYCYWTRHGMAGWRAVDIDQPASDVVLFDGDAWHQSGDSASINALFADGHVQNLTPQQFGALQQGSIN